MIQLDIPMPKCCYECFALDDNGDYPYCLISHDQRGYTFNTREQRMPTCPLKPCAPRVLTLEEVREKKPFVLWVEDIYTGARVFPVAYIKGIYQDSALDWIVDIDAPVEEYNVSWRFWTLCPTYEQRSKTLWPNLK